MDIKHCFEILGVDESATPSDIKKSYLDLAYVWNPNKFIKNSKCYQRVLEKNKEINAAYDSLKQYFLLQEEAKIDPQRQKITMSNMQSLDVYDAE